MIYYYLLVLSDYNYLQNSYVSQKILGKLRISLLTIVVSDKQKIQNNQSILLVQQSLHGKLKEKKIIFVPPFSGLGLNFCIIDGSKEKLRNAGLVPTPNKPAGITSGFSFYPI